MFSDKKWEAKCNKNNGWCHSSLIITIWNSTQKLINLLKGTGNALLLIARLLIFLTARILDGLIICVGREPNCQHYVHRQLVGRSVQNSNTFLWGNETGPSALMSVPDDLSWIAQRMWQVGARYSIHGHDTFFPFLWSDSFLSSSKSFTTRIHGSHLRFRISYLYEYVCRLKNGLRARRAVPFQPNLGWCASWLYLAITASKASVTEEQKYKQVEKRE
jgi:hypothetical protein